VPQRDALRLRHVDRFQRDWGLPAISPMGILEPQDPGKKSNLGHPGAFITPRLISTEAVALLRVLLN
jgi:hypothetical protein